MGARLRDERLSPLFVLIAALFVTALITANIVAVKLVDVGGLVVPAGTVTLFPLSYLFGDVLTEVYGFRRARLVIWLGFLCNLIAVLAIYVTMILPAASFWHGQAAYEQILGYTPRLLVGSFAAYLVGEFANSFILAKLKILTRGRWLWTRTIGSTLVGEGLDSLIFITIAFVGTVTTGELVQTMVTAWLLKSAYEVAATPLTYAVVGYLKRSEGVDVYDYTTNFSPLRLD
ncbi:MAG TPA: queuosine precursor transporter [Thermomicrobiaceae bacterium]|nr:queuosine precursor transporter [Thermomicrobiaceae bacterium]